MRLSYQFPRVWLAAALLMAPSSGTFAVGSADEIQVVYPMGLFPDDAQNVQAAVDLGGTVLLKATSVGGQPASFNFGPPDVGSYVALRTGVNLLGEARHGAHTTIEGGVFPIVGRTPGRLRISGIHFNHPQGSAVVILEAESVEFTDNRISDVVPALEIAADVGITVEEGRGLKFLGQDSRPLTTRALIGGNIFEGLRAQLSEAILFEFVNGDVDIRNNRIDIASSNGLYISSSGAYFQIAGNFIRPGAGDESTAGNGILIVGDRNGSYRIARNSIECANPFADGVFVFAPTDLGPVNDLLVIGNDISMTATRFEAIGLQGAVNQAYVSLNRITGNGFAALSIYSLKADDIAQDDVFTGNTTARYASSAADVWLDTNTLRTLVMGARGTAVDLGRDNRIIGLTRVQP